MSYVELMKNVKLELAAEYLVMAAILMEIKSRLLLPKQHVDDEEVDPRAELVRRLQEYEVIKSAAQSLDKLPRVERDTQLVQVGFAESFTLQSQLSDVDLAELVGALQGIFKRNQAFTHHHIAKETLSTRERMSSILAMLRAQDSEDTFVDFVDLFDVEEGKQGVVVTFLAILELIKESFIECIQSSVFGQINVRLCHVDNRIDYD